MAFDVTPEAYTRFMGRYSLPLAVKFLDLLDPQRGQRVLDVGCGTGIVTAELAERVGQEAVSAIDPSPPFLSAVRMRLPHVDLRDGHAEEMPFDDDTFDLALAQLSVHFMADPARGVAEMARVVRPGGTVAAVVWDVHGGGSPLAVFWRAAHAFDPNAMAASPLPGPEDADLTTIFERAGLQPDGAHRGHRPPVVRQLRGVVGALPARSRPGRRLRHGAGRRAPATGWPRSAATCSRRHRSTSPGRPGSAAPSCDARLTSRRIGSPP